MQFFVAIFHTINRHTFNHSFTSQRNI